MKVFVKPSELGLLIRKPENMLPLNQEGEFVELNSYWNRRLHEKDVILVNVDQESNEPELEGKE